MGPVLTAEEGFLLWAGFSSFSQQTQMPFASDAPSEALWLIPTLRDMLIYNYCQGRILNQTHLKVNLYQASSLLTLD